MTDFLELCKARYSVRSFSDRKVEPEKLEKDVTHSPQREYALTLLGVGHFGGKCAIFADRYGEFSADRRTEQVIR